MYIHTYTLIRIYIWIRILLYIQDIFYCYRRIIYYARICISLSYTPLRLYARAPPTVYAILEQTTSNYMLPIVAFVSVLNTQKIIQFRCKSWNFNCQQLSGNTAVEWTNNRTRDCIYLQLTTGWQIATALALTKRMQKAEMKMIVYKLLYKFKITYFCVYMWVCRSIVAEVVGWCELFASWRYWKQLMNIWTHGMSINMVDVHYLYLHRHISICITVCVYARLCHKLSCPGSYYSV